jgi:hypothetical protein
MAKRLARNMDKVNQVRHVAEEYLAMVRFMIEKLREAYRIESDVLHSVNRHIVPREGQLNDGTEFYFHGVGCTFDAAHTTINMDFGPEGRIDGFSAGHLWQYMQDNGIETNLTLADVQKAIGDLVAGGEVVCPKLLPSPHLCYFVEKSLQDTLVR